MSKPFFAGTLVVLFNPSLKENKLLHTFPSGISPKVIVIARRMFELAYYDIIVALSATPQGLSSLCFRFSPNVIEGEKSQYFQNNVKCICV